MKKYLLMFISFMMMISTISFKDIDANQNQYVLKEVFDSSWKYGSGKVGTPTRMWINATSWEEATKNNQEVFCIDSTKVSLQGANNVILNAQALGYSPVLMDKLALVAYFGYRKQKSVDNYFLTQNLIWELIGKVSKDQTIQHVVSSKYPTRNSQDVWQANVLKQIDDFMKVPSFSKDQISIYKKESSKLVDTNQILADLVIKKVEGGSAKIEGNTLVITPNDQASEMRIVLSRNVSTSQTKTNFIVHAGNDTQPVSNLTSGSDPYKVDLKINLLEPYGYIQIRKKQANSEHVIWIGNAKYQILDENNQVVDTLTTKANANWIKSKALPLGNYTIKEVESPSGYYLDTKSYQIKITKNNQVLSKTFEDEAYGYIQIRKKQANSEHVIWVGNAKYQILDENNQVVDTLTTKANANWIKSKALPLGNYTIKEIESPSGYYLDSKSYQIKITKSNQVLSKTFEDEAYGYIQIRKKDANSEEDLYLGDAIYEILNKENEVVDTLTTKNTSEWIKSKPLPLGEYHLKEKVAPKGYTLDTKTYQINLVKANVIMSKTLYDLKHASVAIFKIDADSKQPLKDVEFAISAYSDMSKAFGRKKTNAEGIALFTKLNQGQVYYIQEVKGLDGYRIDSTIHKVWIDDQHLSWSITVENELKKGSVELIKIDQDSKEKLDGVTFGISKNQDMKELLQTKVSKDGSVIFDNLEYGTYYIQELASIDGYKCDKEIYEVIIDDDHQKIVKEISNQAIKTYFRKVDATTNEKVIGAKLQVIEKESGKIIDEWISDESDHEIKYLKLNVPYLFKEIASPSGYCLGKDLEFMIEDDQQIQTLVMENIPYMLFSKQDASTSKEIIGAKLEIIDFDTNEVVASWTSSDTPYQVKGLISGQKYRLHESLAPIGYDYASDIEFVAGAGIKVEMKDELIYGEIKIQKENEDGNPIENVTFILGKDEKMQDMIATSKTDEDGICYFRNIPYGTYYIKEESVAGYKVNDKIYQVEITSQKQIVNLVIVNESIQSSFLKIDAYTKKPIEGVALRVVEKESGKVIDEWISTLLPHYILNLEVGKTYLFEEIKSLKGYKKHQPIIFTLENDEGVHLVMENHTITKITKVDDQLKPLKGVELAIYDHNTLITKWISDEKPHIIYDLEIDKQYTLKEIKGLEGYKMADEIIIKAGDDITFINKRLGNITLHKIEAGSKKPIMNLTFEFELYKDKTCKEKILRVKTNDQGIAYFKDLEYGTYYIKEVKSAQDYLLSKQILKVEVNKNNVDVNFENSKSVKTGVGSNPSTPYIILLVFSFIVIVATNKAILIKNGKKKMKKIKK